MGTRRAWPACGDPRSAKPRRSSATSLDALDAGQRAEVQRTHRTANGPSSAAPRGSGAPQLTHRPEVPASMRTIAASISPICACGRRCAAGRPGRAPTGAVGQRLLAPVAAVGPLVLRGAGGRGSWCRARGQRIPRGIREEAVTGGGGSPSAQLTPKASHRPAPSPVRLRPRTAVLADCGPACPSPSASTHAVRQPRGSRVSGSPAGPLLHRGRGHVHRYHPLTGPASLPDRGP